VLFSGVDLHFYDEIEIESVRFCYLLKLLWL
jgi:hypothetical protein